MFRDYQAKSLEDVYLEDIPHIRHPGMAAVTLANALSRPGSKDKWLIIRALNLHPAEIWPSRYEDESELRQPKNPLPVRCKL